MCCLDEKIVGIAYCSNEISSSCQLPAINLAIPILQFNVSDNYGFPKNFLQVTDSINFGYFNRTLDDLVILNNIKHAKGLSNTKAFEFAEPISTFNTMVEWNDLSYDNFRGYMDSIYYRFDDFILYMNAFKNIK